MPISLLDLTLSTATENVALDEALLDEAETSQEPIETLRFWEPPSPMVIIGRSSKIEQEVHSDYCQKLDIPIIRRVSGGAAIVTGPGCLMYALVLSYRRRPWLRTISETHSFVLNTIAEAIKPLLNGLQPVMCGTSDLAIGDRKFSGNSARCRHESFLYHGTLLYNFPLDLIQHCLKMPPRMPGYRRDRSHEHFLMNLPVDGKKLRQAIARAFGAMQPREEWPLARLVHLVSQKYSRSLWNILGRQR